MQLDAFQQIDTINNRILDAPHGMFQLGQQDEYRMEFESGQSTDQIVSNQSHYQNSYTKDLTQALEKFKKAFLEKKIGAEQPFSTISNDFSKRNSTQKELEQLV